MARPRFLDRLDRERRAVLEPELRREVLAGRTIPELLAWAHSKGITVGQSALSDFRREVLGSASEDATARVQREVAAAPAPSTAPAPAATSNPTTGPAAPGVDLDHRAILLEQLERAQKTARTEQNANMRTSADKLVLDITERLRALDKEVKGEQGPKVNFYFPEKVAIEMCESDEG